MSVLLQYRFVFVIALLAVAAALLTDRNRLPLALRGLRRTLGGDAQASDSRKPISRTRRIVAFSLVVLAFVLAVAPSPL